ncbi:hypothetical protein FF38_00316 [Lucilia cuprina]|uniref:Uncharacterized protein n=1 Tax=Lucilia cuprina TaxID=7375 RepID=A0A0L0BLW5_LUCCU|nr:hypothetical protein FF38_00316 [Lucilia cuprina]
MNRMKKPIQLKAITQFLLGLLLLLNGVLIIILTRLLTSVMTSSFSKELVMVLNLADIRIYQPFFKNEAKVLQNFEIYFKRKLYKVDQFVYHNRVSISNDFVFKGTGSRSNGDTSRSKAVVKESEVVLFSFVLDLVILVQKSSGSSEYDLKLGSTGRPQCKPATKAELIIRVRESYKTSWNNETEAFRFLHSEHFFKKRSKERVSEP